MTNPIFILFVSITELKLILGFDWKRLSKKCTEAEGDDDDDDDDCNFAKEKDNEIKIVFAKIVPTIIIPDIKNKLKNIIFFMVLDKNYNA